MKNWTRGLFFFFSLLGEGFQYRSGSTHTRSVTRTIHFLTRSKFLHFFGKKQRRTLLWEKMDKFSFAWRFASFFTAFLPSILSSSHEGDALSRDQHCCVCFRNRFSNSDLLFTIRHTLHHCSSRELLNTLRNMAIFFLSLLNKLQISTNWKKMQNFRS